MKFCGANLLANPILQLATILVCLLFVQLSSALPSESCSESLIEPSTVAKIYRLAWHQPGLYEHDKCHVNVIRLFNFLSSKISSITASDFNVILIARKGAWDRVGNWILGQSYTAAARQGRGKWKLHVALEYHGMILDLDRTNYPIPISAADYVKTMIPHPRLNHVGVSEGIGELSAVILPGEVYLNLAENDVDSAEFIGTVLNFNTVIPYLEIPQALRQVTKE